MAEGEGIQRQEHLVDSGKALAETFLFPAGEAIAFHGTGDPWAETEVIKMACAERDIPLYITENANHSLETGHLETDLRILSETMEKAAVCLETRNVKNEPWHI